MKSILAKLLSGNHLTEVESKQYMEEIIKGNIPPHQVTAFMVGLKVLGETTAEIVGLAKAMREKMTIPFKAEGPLLDTCGTGGDGFGTINVSTAAALVASSAGINVAKHGNRAVSGKSGSADVLEALEIPIEQANSEQEMIFRKENIVFLFAPLHHQGMRHAAVSRKELGLRTVFNILGPLSNPLQADHQVMGVYDPELTEPLAHVLKGLGLKRALVLAGLDGLDEITTSSETKISELNNGDIKTYTVTPEEFGIKRALINDLRGESAKENARVLMEIFQGKKGAKRDFILLNSAAAFYTIGLAKNLSEGIEIAKELIDSGKVYQKVKRLQSFNKQAGQAV